MKLKSLRLVGVEGKRVLFRVDYNVPLSFGNGKNRRVVDDTRIRLTLPTLHYLIRHKARVIIVSHLGRPEGVDFRLSLEPVARRLEKLLGREVKLIRGRISPRAEELVSQLKPGELLMLDNIRFNRGEVRNRLALAKKLAGLADLMVNDGFAVSHRAHASVAALSRLLPVVAGFHLMLEVKMLSRLTERPKRPFVALIGGAKVADKVDAIHNLAKLADSVLVGGGVANNFLKAEGVDVLSSYLKDTVVDEKKRGVDYVKFAKKLLSLAPKEKMLLRGYIPVPNIVAPIDVVAADKANNHSTKCTLNLVEPQKSDCPDGKLKFLDIGKATIKYYKQVINHAKTIFWNGPMGVFENPAFATGTRQIAQAVATAPGLTILGGGDTIAAIKKFHLYSKYDYVSSAGGAALEFLAGKKLPGLEPMRIH